MIESKQQAQLLSRYLLGQSPTPLATKLYVNAVSLQPEFSQRDARLLKLAFAHPGLIGYFDASLGFFRPAAELRRRLYLMFSILEAMPEYTEYFLPQSRPRLYVVKVGAAGIRSVCRLAAGTLILVLGRL